MQRRHPKRRVPLLPHQTLSMPDRPLNPRRKLRAHANGTWSYRDPDTLAYVGPFPTDADATAAFHEKWPLICPIRRPRT